MTERWRGKDAEPWPNRWFRGRWKYGSVCVLDIDTVVCSFDGERGLLVEWKRSDAKDKTWTVTQKLARRAGWFAARFVYDTASDGSPCNIQITAQDIDGKIHPTVPLDEAWFDGWVCEQLGARPREDVA